MAIGLDKIVFYAPVVLIVILLLMVLFAELFGCKLNSQWNNIFNLNMDSLFTPGIKVMG